MDQTEESIRELKNRLFKMYSFEGKKREGERERRKLIKILEEPYINKYWGY